MYRKKPLKTSKLGIPSTVKPAAPGQPVKSTSTTVNEQSSGGLVNLADVPGTQVYAGSSTVVATPGGDIIVETSKDVYVSTYVNALDQKYIVNGTAGNPDVGSVTGSVFSNIVPEVAQLGFDTDGGFTVTSLGSGFALVGISGNVSGYSGASGISGYSGHSGLDGFSGTSGLSGYSGASGVRGTSGYSGVNGVIGASGYSGVNGLSGYSGLSGWSGFSGADGTQGTSGYSGQEGQLGPQGISGYSGQSGLDGLSGISGWSGYSGSSGFSGPPGFSSILFEYTSLTSSQTPPPGAGIVQWNNPVQVSATELYVNNVTNDGIDIYLFLELLNQTETITLQDKSDSANYQTFTIAGTPIYGAGWWTIPVTLYTSGGTPFPDAHELILTLVQGISGWSGWSGLSGASGWSGPTGTSGYSGQVGPTGPQGTSGYSGQAGASGVSGASVSLTSTYIGYGSPSNTVTGSAQLTWNDASRVLTIGSNVAYESTTIKGRSQDGLGLPGTLQIAGADGGISVGGDLVIKGGRSAGSTPGGDLYVQAGDSLNVGDGGSNTGPTLYLRGGTGGGAYPDPGVIVFQTSNLGDVPQTYVERLRMRGTGALSFGSTGTAYGAPGEVLVSNGDSPPSWQTLATASGYSGYSGVGGPGTSGFSGYSGVGGPGTSGFSGISGSQGASGHSGISGYSGVGGPGTSGFSGYSGVGGPGTSGYSGAASQINISNSVFLDGNGDYLTVANSSNFDFGTGAFTIEGWTYIAANSTANPDGNRYASIVNAFFDSTASTGWRLAIIGNTTTTGTGLQFNVFNAGVSTDIVTTATTVTQNAWHHVAVSRTGNTFYLFLDGVQVATNTFSGNVNSGGFDLDIGSLQQGVAPKYYNYLNGYVSNIRIVKGSAVYTGAFTPPTSPLTSITGTVLLVCQSNVFAGITTVAGNSSISTANPFGNANYSGYSGLSGYSGISGYSGESGTSGWSGESGASGYSGISGFSGYSGTGGSGFSGYSGTTPDLSGYVTLTGTQTLTNKTYTGVRETKVAMAANDVDMSAGNYFTKTITTSTVFTASNVPASGTTGSFIMELTNAGSQTITWFTGTTWASGVAPTLTSAGVDILGFYTFDGGTTWRGLTLALDIK